MLPKKRDEIFCLYVAKKTRHSTFCRAIAIRAVHPHSIILYIYYFVNPILNCVFSFVLLQKIITVLLLKWFILNPIVALEEQRIGCTAQCPLCGVACAGTVSCQNESAREKTNQRHRTEIHMPAVSILLELNPK
jgi:hypothetical protein